MSVASVAFVAFAVCWFAWLFKQASRDVEKETEEIEARRQADREREIGIGAEQSRLHRWEYKA